VLPPAAGDETAIARGKIAADIGGDHPDGMPKGSECVSLTHQSRIVAGMCGADQTDPHGQEHSAIAQPARNSLTTDASRAR